MLTPQLEREITGKLQETAVKAIGSRAVSALRGTRTGLPILGYGHYPLSVVHRQPGCVHKGPVSDLLLSGGEVRGSMKRICVVIFGRKKKNLLLLFKINQLCLFQCALSTCALYLRTIGLSTLVFCIKPWTQNSPILSFQNSSLILKT